MGKHSKTAKSSSYYFDLKLAEHKKAAQITALAAAMNAAVICAAGRCACKKQFTNHLDVLGQGMLAFNFIRLYSTTVVKGRRGVNDLEQFSAIFREIVPRVYPAFLRFLQSHPDALAALQLLSDKERLTTLKTAAEAQLHLLSLPSDNPLPLTWPAPEQKKSEVL